MRVLKDTRRSYLQDNYGLHSKWGIAFVLLSIPTFIVGFALGNIGVAIFLGVITLSIGVRLLKSAGNYKAGIEGEQAVVTTLSKLDDSYYLINDIMTEWGNIDHILLSHKGIFVIETKNYTGDIRCEGDHWKKKVNRRLYHMSSVTLQAKNNAKFVSSKIHGRFNRRIPVVPMCVFTNYDAKLRLYKPTIPVLRLNELDGFIQKYRAWTLLSDFEVHRASECILGNTTDLEIQMPARGGANT